MKKVKPIILESQSNIYSVNAVGQVHSTWIDKEKAEETLRVLQNFWLDAYMDVIKVNDVVVSKTGHNVIIDVTNGKNVETLECLITQMGGKRS